ncbi:tetratricopeptide repeat protein [Bradyrhizobium sp. LB12.1]|uniref:tetratricopeptide repeat protein n=1 Tax=unclassified Bradyrhizobium TaxID=2631580 RepID=UPI0033936AF8
MADRAVALNPNSWRTWNNRGWVYIMAGLPEEAVRYSHEPGRPTATHDVSGYWACSYGASPL